MSSTTTELLPHERVNIDTPTTEILIVIDVVFIVVTLIGNGIIVYVAGRSRQLRSPSILFIASVATSHLFVGALVLPMFIISHFTDDLMTSFTCKALSYLSKFASTASLAAIVPLTLDALLRNKGYYKNNPLSWRSAILQVCVTWIFAGLYAIGHCVLIEFRIITGKDEHGPWHTKVCHIPDDVFQTHQIIVMVDFTVLFLLPIILLSVVLAFVCKLYVQHDHSESSEDERERRRLSTRTSALFLAAFTIFNLGNYFLTIYVFWGPGSFRHMHLVTSICSLVGFCMCWVNVLMIMIFNSAFRRKVLAKTSRTATLEIKDRHDANSNDKHSHENTQLESNV